MVERSGVLSRTRLLFREVSLRPDGSPSRAILNWRRAVGGRLFPPESGFNPERSHCVLTGLPPEAGLIGGGWPFAAGLSAESGREGDAGALRGGPIKSH